MPTLTEILEGKRKIGEPVAESISDQETLPIQEPVSIDDVSPEELESFEPVESVSSIFKGKKKVNLTGGTDTGESLEQDDQTYWERAKNLFKDTDKAAADATLSIVDAEMQNIGRPEGDARITPTQAKMFRKQIDKGVKLNPSRAALRSDLKTVVSKNLEAGYGQVNLGLLASQALMGDNSPETLSAIKQTQDAIPKQDEMPYPTNLAQELGQSTAQLLPFITEATKRGAWRGLILGGGTWMLGTATGTPEFTYPLVPAMYAIGQTSASLEFVSKVEGGLAYMDLLDYVDPKTKEKINPEVARAAAFGVGTINGLLELAQIKTLMNTIPGGKKLFSGIINDTVKEVVANQSMKNLAAEHVSKFGSTIVKETVQELAQESTNITADILSRRLTNALDKTDLSDPKKADIVNRLTQTAKQSAQGFAVLALPGTGLSAGTKFFQKKKADATEAAETKIFKAGLGQQIKEVKKGIQADKFDITDEEVDEIINTLEASEIKDEDIDVLTSSEDLDDFTNKLIDKYQPELKDDIVFQQPIESPARESIREAVVSHPKYTPELVEDYMAIWDGIAHSMVESGEINNPSEFYDMWSFQVGGEVTEEGVFQKILPDQQTQDLLVEINNEYTDQNIVFDGIFDRSALNKEPLYQFTPQSGPMEGRTIVVEELSADAIRNKFEGLDREPLFQTPQTETFFSQLNKAITEIKQEKAPGQQWSAMIKKLPIKKEEIEWSGIDEFLKGKNSVTKQEILDYLDQNKVVIEDVIKGLEGTASHPTVEEVSDANEILSEGGEIYAIDSSGQAIKIVEDSNKIAPYITDNWDNYTVKQGSIDSVTRENPTKFAQYQLPGGKNYKEILLTLPGRALTELPEQYIVAKDDKPLAGSGEPLFFRGKPATHTWVVFDTEGSKFFFKEGSPIATVTNGTKEEAIAEALGKINKEQKGAFQSSHFDEPNILAHIRMSEREVNGKKVLHIEEVQSDWLQAGRKKGFQKDITKEKLAIVKKITPYFDSSDLLSGEKEALDIKVDDVIGDPLVLEEMGVPQNLIDESVRFAEKERDNRTGVPDAPFKKTWPLLTIKRMVRYAAENGFDTIAWTTGELQAERYDLSKQISKVTYRKSDDGTYYLKAVSKDTGKSVFTQSGLNESDIEDHIGKDLAQKIINNEGKIDDSTDSQKDVNRFAKEGNEFRELSGLDLKVGGEGMKAFYDKMLPSVIKKFFGKKAWGKPEIGEIAIGEPNIYASETIGGDFVIKNKVGEYLVDDKTREFSKHQEDAQTFDSIKDANSYLAGKTGETSVTLHSLEITPEMKEKALSEGLPLFQKDKAEPLGQIENLFSEDPVIIKAFAGANPSTPIHETGHFLTKILHKSRPEDYKTLADWVGVPQERQDQGIDSWTTGELEKSAKAFEAYVMEGKAPTKDLKPVFQRLKELLIEVYKTVKTLGIELSPEVRKVFDRLVAPTKKEKSLFSAIKEAGGINFGEAGVKDFPKGTGFLSRPKTGLSLSEMEAKLKEDGWIREDENLVDVIKNKALKRGEGAKRAINIEAIEGLGGREALSRALKVAAQDAQAAFKAGDMVGFERGKAKIKALIGKSKKAQALRNDAKKIKTRVLKEIKKTQVKKQSGKPKGRFGAERQETLDILRENVGLTQTAATEKLISNLDKYSDRFPTEAEAFENRVLSMLSTRAFDVTDQTIEEWSKLLGDVKAFKEQGVLEREVKTANRAALHDFYRREVIETVGGIPEGIETVGEEAVTDKTLKTRIRNAVFSGSTFNVVAGWKDLLDVISFKDKASKPFESPISKLGDVLDAKNEEKLGNMNQMEGLRDIIFDIYKLKSDRQMVKMFEKDSIIQDLGTFTNLRNEVVELKMSRGQARKRMMEILDPSLHDAIFSIEGMGWTEDMVVSLRSFLNPNDEEFIERQMEFYRDYYKGVNDVYSEIYGVNLPRNDFYSPISREGVQKSDSGLGEFLKEMPMRASVTSGSLKARTKNLFTLQARMDVDVLMSHVSEMEHFKAWAEKVRELNAVFGDPEVRQAIRINFGKSVDNHIQNFIKAFANNGSETAQNITGIDKIRTSYTKSVLAVKPTLFLKQLTSAIAYADAIPAGQFAKEFVKFHELKKGTEILMESTLMKDRWNKASIERDIKSATSTEEFSAFRTSPSFTNALMALVKMGDAAAIIAGGYPVYKYHRKQGKTHKEALRIFEQVTESTQQSSDLSEQSVWQRGGSFAKLFTMFMSSPNQYFRKEVGALRNLVSGRATKTEVLKTLAIYHILLPMLFQWVSDRFTWDEDEQKRAMTLGPLNGYFIAGEALNYMVREIYGLRTFEPSVPIYQIPKDFGKALDLIRPEELEPEEFLRAVRGLAGATGGLTGLPLKQTVDLTTGISDTLSGDFEIGIAELLGYSPFKAKQAAEKE